MAKVLLIGSAGCGKTHRLLDSFKQALSQADDPLAADLFFVVPSAEHTERVVSLLIQRGIKGFFHKRVTTLSRLADGLFRATDIPVASGLTRALIVRDLVRENAWDYFSEVWEQPGFIGLMAQFVIELKEACISPGIFRERMNRLKSFEPAYAAKYEALACFYEQYEAQLKGRGLRDSQDALRIFRARKRGQTPFSDEREKGPDPLISRFKAIWIDGFFDFSNLQLEYLRELSAITEHITITLTKEEGPGAEDAFGAVNRTQQDLEKLGFKVEPVKAHSYRTQKPALLFLQKNLFSSQAFPHPGPLPTGEGKNGSLSPRERLGEEGDIVMLEAIGTEGEIELIARQIHKLCRTGEYRYSDFAVLFRQVRQYAPVMASVFSRYGIPAEIHERDRLKFSPWIAAAAGLLSVFLNGWQREDVFAFLKSGYTRFFGKDKVKDEAWLAEFERRSFLEGVAETREAWLADWKKGSDPFPPQGAGRMRPSAQKSSGGQTPFSIEFNQKKTEMLKALVELEDRFLAAKNAEEHARTFKHAVYDTFGILKIDDRYHPFARRDAACVRRFEALLDEIQGYSLKGKAQEVSFKSFADHFLGLVELDVYSLHERDKNRVQVYDVSLARQKEYKVVFVAGLLEKVFPMQVREDPLLSDWERKLMNSEGEPLFAECLPRQQIERFLFYLAVTRAKERLYLSYPHVDFQGQESLPSFYLEEVKDLFKDRIPVIRQDLSRPFPEAGDAITRRELEISVIGALRTPKSHSPIPLSLSKGGEDKGEGDLGEVLTRLSGDPQSRERILSALRPVEAKISDEKIAQGKYFEITETSPTRLETYAKCPFRYFADKVLRLQDDTGDTSAMQKGSILHHVLQKYFDPQRKKDPGETPEQFIEREMEEGFKRYPILWAEPYKEALDRREIFEMLLDFIKFETERLENASFKPCRVEYGFGSGSESDAPALKLEMSENAAPSPLSSPPRRGRGTGEGVSLDVPKEGGRELRIRGRVDRIDTDAEKKCCVVMDYKRSAKFRAADLELGTALQLPLYLLAAQKRLGLQPLGAEIYSIRDHKRSGFYCEGLAKTFEKEFSSRSSLPDAVFQKTLDRALVFVRKFTKEIGSCGIPVRPRECESFCPYDTLCRIEKWRLPLISEEIKEADRKDPSLASLCPPGEEEREGESLVK